MSDLAKSPSVLRHVPPGERVLLAMHPSVLFIPLAPLGTIVIILLVTWLAGYALDRLALAAAGDRQLVARLRNTAAMIGGVGVTVVILRVLWQALEWWCRLYVLTNARVLRIGGVLQRSVVEVPLERVQHTTVYRSLRERLTGLGTLGVNTAGTAFTELFWVMVPRPYDVHARIRGAAEARAISTPAPGRPMILGLAGGIGSGKSTVARELEKHGALVVDSDREAREALDRPEVRSELIRWWGPSVIGEDGRVDRSKVGGIVFADPEQRRRLESLVHPIVRQSRAQLIRQAEQKGVRLVVVDAPLLYEAGVDRECDRVLFVEAPRELRLARVGSRGWDQEELARREKAQIPLEEKRSRADAIILNDADEAALALRVGQFLKTIGF